jgi:hypothetical protein
MKVLRITEIRDLVPHLCGTAWESAEASVIEEAEAVIIILFSLLVLAGLLNVVVYQAMSQRKIKLGTKRAVSVV